MVFFLDFFEEIYYIGMAGVMTLLIYHKKDFFEKKYFTPPPPPLVTGGDRVHHLPQLAVHNADLFWAHNVYTFIMSLLRLFKDDLH